MTAPAGARPRPSLFDIVFVIWAIAIPVGFGYRLLNSDGECWEATYSSTVLNQADRLKAKAD